MMEGKEGFIWLENFSVGHSSMDDQHKTIIKLVNELNNIISPDGNEVDIPQKISETFDELKKYTLTHISDEEKLMESISYPNLAWHKNYHRNIVNKTHDWQQRCFCESDDVVEVFNFLKKWWYNHILCIDMDYKKFLNS